jgi:hypothetical protein
MTNPLDEYMEVFNNTRDAFKVSRRVLDQRQNPVSNTGFYGLTPQEGHARLDRAEELLDKLVAFALFATFERSLRNHLSKSLNPLAASSTIPTELAVKLHQFLEGGVDNWRLDGVIELFNPPVPDQDVNNAKNIKTYRNNVAHGTAPSVAMQPTQVYEQLSVFLENAGLLT